MCYYKLNKKYEDLDCDLIFPKTTTYNMWLSETLPEIKLLSLLAGCIDANISEHFEIGELLFDALDNEFNNMGFSFERNDIKYLLDELVKLGYLDYN